jgi:hypothetical protein
VPVLIVRVIARDRFAAPTSKNFLRRFLRRLPGAVSVPARCVGFRPAARCVDLAVRVLADIPNPNLAPVRVRGCPPAPGPLPAARYVDIEIPRLIAAAILPETAPPFGPAQYRALDHQSTLGAFVGKTALKNGKGTMVDWRYADGANYLPPDAEVIAMRPAEARS